MKTKKKNKKNYSIIIVIAIVVILILMVILLTKNNSYNSPSEKEKIEEKDPLKFRDSDNDYLLEGEVIVTGYAILNFKAVDCGNSGPCTEDTIKSIEDLVKFEITEVNSKNITKAMKNWDNNEKFIQLGCVNNNIITYASAADEYGVSGDNQEAYIKTFSLSEDLSNSILKSDMDNPITLKLTKLKLTHKVNIDNQCKSMFDKIEIVN